MGVEDRSMLRYQVYRFISTDLYLIYREGALHLRAEAFIATNCESRFQVLVASQLE